MSFESLVVKIKRSYSVQKNTKGRWEMRFLGWMFTSKKEKLQEAQQECAEKIAGKIQSIYGETNPFFAELERK